MPRRPSLIIATFLLLLQLPLQAFACHTPPPDTGDAIALIKSRIRLNRRTMISHVKVALQNVTAEERIRGPIRVVLAGVTNPRVTIANADGHTEEGLPYFEYCSAGEILGPGEKTSAKRWKFSNPQRRRFRFKVHDITWAPDTPQQDPLTIHVSTPQNNAVLHAAAVTVAGTVSRDDAQVTVKGVPAYRSEGRFVAEDVPLTPGDSSITVEAIAAPHHVQETVAVTVLTADLAPSDLSIVALSQDSSGLKVQGEARLTLLNDGTGDIIAPYGVILFEDRNANGSYEPGTDSPLGTAEVPEGPISGGSMDIVVAFQGDLLFASNRIGAHVDHRDAIVETDESNNTGFSRRGGMDISVSRPRSDLSHCPDATALSARLGNAGDDTLPAGIAVSFYHGDPLSDGSLLGTALTRQPLPPGGYADVALDVSGAVSDGRITIVADDDGTGTGRIAEIDELNNSALLDIPACPQTSGNAPLYSGIALDALTAAGLPGVQITLVHQSDGLADAVAGQTQTDADGRFQLDLPSPGAYLLIADRDGYIQTRLPVSIPVTAVPEPQHIVLSPLLDPDQIRIILTWNATPADLEAHITGANPDGCRRHCFYWNRSIPGAVLDADDTDGYGPETITLTASGTGTYRYYVHDFSNRLTRGSALAQSGATVTVYFGDNRPPQTFPVPNTPGTVWHVFDISDGGAALDPVNRMAFQSEPGKIDFPVWASTPQTRAPWGMPYVYAFSAADPDGDALFFDLLQAPAGMTLDRQTGTLTWPAEAMQIGTHDVVLRVRDGSCGEAIQPFRVSVTHRPVVHFSVDPCSGVNPGGQITLSWTTHLADTVVIDQGIGAVAASGSIALDSPQEPTVYTISASNAIATVQETAPHAPADPMLKHCGGILNWSAACAAECSIIPDIGSVPCQGALVLEEDDQTTYRLDAVNAVATIGTTMNTACSDSFGNPFQQPLCQWTPGTAVIIDLGSNPAFDTCALDQGVGPVPCSGEITLSPAAPTTYTLTAAGPAGSVTRQITVPQLTPPSASFTAAPLTIHPGEASTLYWQTHCAASCRITPDVGPVESQGTVTVVPATLPATYTLEASGASATATRHVTVGHHLPSITLNAAPATIKVGETATLIWSAQYADSCRIEPDIGLVATTGAITVQPQQNSTYRLVADGPGGTATAFATVSFVKPTAHLQADPELLLPGQSATLSWTFANADHCTIEPDIGAVQLGQSVTVIPETTTTYTMRAEGPGGTALDSVTIAYPAPTVSISADPAAVADLQETTLTWTSTYATACTITPDIGAVPLNGSTTVVGTQSQTYVIEASGPGGKTTADVTLACLPPTIDHFFVSPDAVTLGDTAALSWDVHHVDTVLIGSLGELPASGSIPVAPARTTEYTLVASGCGESVRSTIPLQVLCPPSLSFAEPNGTNDTAHTSYLIRWEDADCDHNAAIDLYYDTDDSGADGTLIAAGLLEDDDGEADRYPWDTTAMPEGKYYLYARLDDGTSLPVIVYAEHPVTIDHAPLPFGHSTLIAPDGMAADQFGSSIDLDAVRIVVGAPGNDEAGENAGAVYTFKQAAGQWIPYAKITASNAAAGDRFGAAVSVDGDRLIVGAPGQGERGVAYLFHYEEGQWRQEALLVPPPSGDSYDNFGTAVALCGEMAVVGAPWTNTAHIFTRQEALWSHRQRLRAGDGAGESNFGSTLAIEGETILVGTRRFFMGFGTEGAYVFRPYYGQYIEETKLIGLDAHDYDLFGYSVSLDGDTALVGSPGANGVYLFDRDETGWGWNQSAKLTPSDAAEAFDFGAAATIDGPFAYIGAAADRTYTESANNAVYIFRNTNGAWSEQIRLSTGPGAAAADYGRAVAEENGVLLVAAKLQSTGQEAPGAVHLYSLCDADLDAQFAAVAPGEPTTLTWTSSGADRCVIAPDIGEVSAQGSITVSPEQTTTYTITAMGPYGQTVEQTTVWVGTEPPTVHFSATEHTIAAGQSTALTWASTMASQVIIEPSVGTFSPNGTVHVSPEQTTTYSITATGPGGAAQADVTVTVAVQAPLASIQVDPDAVPAGQAVTLSWQSLNAHTVILQPDIGVVEPIGSLQVTPQSTTTYTLTAHGPGGFTSTTATVRILAAPSAEIRIDPSIISAGDQATLTWASSEAESVTITPDIGPVPPTGARAISPPRTTAYTIKATNPFGSTLARAVVTVGEAPTADIFADDLYVDSGSATSLRWTCAHAEQCAIAPDIGPVPDSGAITVSPPFDTTYTLTATGPAVTATAETRIYIRGTGYGNPTPTEQAHIEALNRARMNPPAEAARLNIDLNEGLPANTIPPRPVQPLACSARLLEAARLHANDMLTNHYVAHSSPDGRTPGDRLDQVGYPYALQAENLAVYYAMDPLDDAWAALQAHDDLFLDSTVAGRGHRLTILNPGLREVGAGLAAGPFEHYPHGVLLACDLAASAEELRPFVLGVVYDDIDGDGRYTAGEGLADTAIVVAETGASTASASAGGFRIPLDPGDYTLQATLADGRQFTRTFTIDDQNVKVDFDLTPLPAIAFAVDTDTFLPGDAVALTWSVSGADACTITPDIGPVGPNGSVSVHPTQTTVYTLTAAGPGGTATQDLTIAALPPQIILSAAPRGVAPGQPATLQWEASGADTCQIDPGIGPVTCTGEHIISLEETTAYTLTASGTGGTATETITLWIDTAPPEVETITPAPDSGVDTVNGYFDVLVTAADPGSGLCDVALSDGSGTDLSHLLRTDGSAVSWSAHTGGPLNYLLTLQDCAGNAIRIPIAYTSLDVPESADYGPPDPAGADAVGGGIRITNGNVFKRIDIADLPTPNRLGLGLALYYNSRPTALNSFAYGWTHTYAASLTSESAPDGQARVHIQDATGRSVFFAGGSSFQPLYNEPSSLVFVDGQYIWQRIDGSRCGFGINGRLQWMQDSVGNRLEMTYADGLLVLVSDLASGRMLTFTYEDGSIAAVTGPATPSVPDGVLAAFTYDDYSNLVSVTRADGSAVECFYTDSADPNNLTRLEDGSGTVLAQWSYDSLDRAVNSRLADDTGVSVDYAGADTVTVTDAYGMERTYALTNVSGTVRVTALESGPALSPYHPRPAVRWQYDDRLNLVEIEYAAGTTEQPRSSITRFENHDDRGNPHTIISAWGTPEERSVHFTYHPDFNRVLTRSETSVVDDHLIKETIYDYDTDGNAIPNESPGSLLRRIIEKGWTHQNGLPVANTAVSTFDYNARGQLIRLDGPREDVDDTVTYTYDPATGNRSAATYPRIGTVTFTDHDAAGRPGKITDFNGIATTLEYDGGGRIIGTANQANDTSTVHFFDEGRLIQTTDRDGVTDSFTYDPETGRPDTRTDHMGNTIHTTYDPFGNPDGLLRYSPENRTIPASRRSWSYGHPETPGRLYRAFEPEPGNDTRDIYTQYGYDLAGNIDTITDPIGNTVRYAFDRHNRITEIIHPDGSTQQFGYDSHGNLHTVTDGNRQVTTFEHDDRGRRISETSADTGTSRFEYDVAGNLTRSVDARGVEITYAYDALGRIETIDSPPLDGLPPASITYRYDQGPGGIGQLTGMADASGTTTWDYSRYHDQGIVTKTSTVNGLEQVVTTTRSPGGRIRRLTYPSGRTVDYHRSACACAVSDVTTTMDGITTPLLSNIAYRPFGRPTALGIGASDVANIDNHYDAAGRLTVSNPGTPNARRYTHDASGNPASIEITSIPLTSQTIAYDSLNRITSHLGLLGRTAYEYDSAGNRAAKTANSDRDTYTYAEGSNQLDHIQSQNGDQTAFTYDTSGNTTSAGNRTYTYDQYNRLVTVHENQEPIAAYTYNGLNQRVTKTTSEGTTTYLYDMDGKLIAETDPANTATQGQEYLYNGNIPIAQTNPQTDTLHHIHTNYLGAVHQLTDPSATIAWEALYTPFGQAIPNASATTTTPWRLPGQYHDQETGLHYNHHRYYDPTTGRYLTPDPIGLTGGPNRYTYANNNPMTRIDPQGLTDDFVKALTGQYYNNFLSSSLEVNLQRAEQFNKNNDRRIRDYKFWLDFTKKEADILQNISSALSSIPPTDGGPLDILALATKIILDDMIYNNRKTEDELWHDYLKYKNMPLKIPQLKHLEKLNSIHSIQCE